MSQGFFLSVLFRMFRCFCGYFLRGFRHPIHPKPIRCSLFEADLIEEKEIPSTVIGEILMDKLKDLDSVAYVRFASVYREFKDVNTFMDEIKKILDNQ